MIKMTKIDTLFMTTAADKTIPFGVAHTNIGLAIYGSNPHCSSLLMRDQEANTKDNLLQSVIASLIMLLS